MKLRVEDSLKLSYICETNWRVVVSPNELGGKYDEARIDLDLRGAIIEATCIDGAGESYKFGQSSTRLSLHLIGEDEREQFVHGLRWLADRLEHGSRVADDWYGEGYRRKTIVEAEYPAGLKDAEKSTPPLH